VGTALLARSVLVLVSVLLLGGIVALLYPSLPTLVTRHSSLITEEVQPPLPLPDKPSIVVLPFVNLSEDPKQEYFSDGITEDLITDLSRISGLFVIARNSAFFYKGKAIKVGDISKELGVRYVLEGRVRKADDRVRITAQLVDATTGHHLWAERYDRSLRDIFALQDEIRQKIVATLKLQLTLREQGYLARKSTDNLEAYDSFLRGSEYFFRFTKETNVQARQMFERALELDPEYAEAYALLGWTYLMEWISQWSQDPQALERASEMAQRAIALDDSLPTPHSTLSQAYLWKRQHEQAIAEGERAIVLGPNSADDYVHLARTLNFAGKPEEAVGLVEKAMHLNPRYPAWYLFELGFAYRLMGRHEEAIVTLKKVIIRNPNFPVAHMQLAAVYSELGRGEEARAEAAEILRISPNFSLEGSRQRAPYKDQARFEGYLAALRQAGLK